MGIATGGFSRAVDVTLDIKQVVGDLEGEADLLAVIEQTLPDLFLGTGDDSSQFEAGGQQAAGLAAMDGSENLERIVDALR